MEQAAKDGLFTELTKHLLITMSKKVLNHISRKYENIQKGIGEIMGGKVLDYEAKDIYRKGISAKLVMLIQKKLQKGCNTEQIADALEESVETIEALIKEHNLI